MSLMRAFTLGRTYQKPQNKIEHQKCFREAKFFISTTKFCEKIEPSVHFFDTFLYLNHLIKAVPKFLTTDTTKFTKKDDGPSFFLSKIQDLSPWLIENTLADAIQFTFFLTVGNLQKFKNNKTAG